MKLYLVLHGKALPKQVDASRPLSDLGRAEVGRVAEFLRPMGLRVQAIWHSDRLRSLQTAEILLPAIRSEQGMVERRDIGRMIGSGRWRGSWSGWRRMWPWWGTCRF